MKRERETRGFSYAYEEAEIRNPAYEKDDYSALAAGLANWATFLNAVEKPATAKEAPVNTPKAELLAEGFTLGLQEREKWL
jgi:hypothetical protein